MTKTEWLDILAYYKAMGQIDKLPDAEYVAAMYDELHNRDARFISYAVRTLVANEPTYNRYPLLSEINKYMPDFSIELRFYREKGDELKKLLAENLPERHWYYPKQKSRIQTLVKYFTGEPGDSMDESEIDQAIQRKFNKYVDWFFDKKKTQQITYKGV